MPEHIDKYGDPFILIPIVIMGVILFCVIYRLIGDIQLFRGSVRLPMALAVTALALYGFDRAVVINIVNSYVAMAFSILVGVAALVKGKWQQKQKSEK
ncbi:MAG: hypothetical protein WC297_03820 [Candidatus Paceibacterota bacterium]|jgi:hypothetical protein